ncbi:MAG: hypothetical protein O7E52_29265 [Candidatus Poribacteria bacterium]|nr:hypothetical protein [Candidatus Poribacteria bacterium]
MKIQREHFYSIPMLPNKYLTALTIIFLLIAFAPHSFAVSKRVVVLYFEDHSRFDSPTGCGCLPTGPFSKIFGGRKDHVRWHLKEGFTELLNRKLKQTELYEPITQDELMDAMAYLNLSKKALQANAENRGALAKALKVEALIVGDIRKFRQERVRANASRTLVEGGRQQSRTTSSYMGSIQILGRLYTASVQLDMRFYSSSGNEIDNPKISASRKHHLGGAKVAALEAIVTEEGTEFRFGNAPRPNKKFRPIVDAGKLNRIEFGSAEYDRTLFGLVTDEALAKVVLALRENIGPGAIASGTVQQADAGGSGASAAQANAIGGTIIYVDAENPEKTYINIGSAKGIAVSQRLRVYTDEPLIDPDTGDVLGVVAKPVGVVEVVEISSDRLSKVRVVEGFGTIKKGDRVRIEPPVQSDKNAAPKKS